MKVKIFNLELDLTSMLPSVTTKYNQKKHIISLIINFNCKYTKTINLWNLSEKWATSSHSNWLLNGKNVHLPYSENENTNYIYFGNLCDNRYTDTVFYARVLFLIRKWNWIYVSVNIVQLNLKNLILEVMRLLIGGQFFVYQLMHLNKCLSCELTSWTFVHLYDLKWNFN